MLENLEKLIKIIRERKISFSDNSYTNKLLNDKNLSVSKVKEEIGELIEAVEQNTNKIHEAADVIYHLMPDAPMNTRTMKFTNISRYQLPLAQVLLYAALLLRLRGVGRRCRCYEALPQPVYKRCHGVLWRVPSFQHTVGTLLTLRFVFSGTQGFTAARGSLVQRQERRCFQKY